MVNIYLYKFHFKSKYGLFFKLLSHTIENHYFFFRRVFKIITKVLFFLCMFNRYFINQITLVKSGLLQNNFAFFHV